MENVIFAWLGLGMLGTLLHSHLAPHEFRFAAGDDDATFDRLFAFVTIMAVVWIPMTLLITILSAGAPRHAPADIISGAYAVFSAALIAGIIIF